MPFAGLHAMMALRAGAKHVTAVDRWLYMALACKETLVTRKPWQRLLPCATAALPFGLAGLQCQCQ